MMRRQNAVKDVIFSFIFVMKNSIKPGKIEISQVNGNLTKKCEENGFYFVSNGIIFGNTGVKMVPI